MGGNNAEVMKNAEFWASAVAPKCLFSQLLTEWADFLNTMFYDNMCYTVVDPGPSFRMRRLLNLWRHDYDIIESRDIIDDVTNRRAVSPIRTFL